MARILNVGGQDRLLIVTSDRDGKRALGGGLEPERGERRRLAGGDRGSQFGGIPVLQALRLGLFDFLLPMRRSDKFRNAVDLLLFVQKAVAGTDVSHAAGRRRALFLFFR